MCVTRKGSLGQRQQLHACQPECSLAARLRPASPPLQVDLRELFSGLDQEASAVANARYRLRSMVCYYGQHYLAFVFAEELAAWLMFDDASVCCVGAWPDVRRKCEAGRIQPSVLFYQAQP